MSVFGTGCRLVVVMIATLLWRDDPTQEERCAQSRTYLLNIPSQPLEGALQDLAKQTGMQIVFFSRLIRGRRASALQGFYTIDAALTALLAGSGLTFRLINDRTIEIVAPSGRLLKGPHLFFASVNLCAR